MDVFMDKNIQLWKRPLSFQRATFHEHSHGYSIPFHSHFHCELGIVGKGSSKWLFPGDVSQSLIEGDCILLAPEEKHHEFTGSDERVMFFFIGFEVEGDAASLFPDLFGSKISLGENFSEVKDLFWRLFREQSSGRKGSEDFLEMYLRLILALLCRSANCHETENVKAKNTSSLSDSQAALIAAATRDFNKNYHCPGIIRETTQFYAVSSAYFSTLFRKCHGVPPYQYIQDLKMRRAKELLMDSRLKIKEIAEELGFVDAAHFSNIFYKEVSMRPSEFRASSPTGRDVS
jgi:AraC-like DNA-binding protein